MSLGENYFSTIIKRSIILVLIAIGIILLVSKEPKPYINGLIFGSTINLLNFRLMYISISKSVSLPPRKAQVYATTNYMIRYLIYGIVLVVAAKADYINLYATVASFLLVKIIILSDTFFDLIRGKMKNK